MLHITNGESVSIPETGLPGEVVYWNDVLHDGPVPCGLSLQQLSRVRERFIAEFFAVPLSEVSFAHRDEALSHFRDHEEVILWFEHDLFDQLQLIQILDWFSGQQDLSRPLISVISVDSYLGPMRPQQLLTLFPARRKVTQAELMTAQAAWSAFCSPEPTGLADLLRRDISPLPFLRSAVRRLLQQYPALDNGLSRTEQQILELAAAGLRHFRELFPAAQKLEESIWIGDSIFLQYVQGLVRAGQPLLTARDGGVEITSFGRLVLEKRADHVRVNGIDRWLGGVHLHGSTIWRWDGVTETICR